MAEVCVIMPLSWNISINKTNFLVTLYIYVSVLPLVIFRREELRIKIFLHDPGYVGANYLPVSSQRCPPSLCIERVEDWFAEREL